MNGRRWAMAIIAAVVLLATCGEVSQVRTSTDGQARVLDD